MDIKINELSAKTFNWLGMNESVVKDVPEFECGSMVVTTPDEVTCERELVDSIALSGIDKETSGMILANKVFVQHLLMFIPSNIRFY